MNSGKVVAAGCAVGAGLALTHLTIGYPADYSSLALAHVLLFTGALIMAVCYYMAHKE